MESGEPGQPGAHAANLAEEGPRLELDSATIRLRPVEEQLVPETQRMHRHAIIKLAFQ